MENLNIQAVDYLTNPWSPAKQTVLKNAVHAEAVEGKGFTIIPFLSTDQIQKLNELFSSEHDMNTPDGGMFYSVYSQDLDYRRKIHERIGKILLPTLESVLKDFRVVLNSFVVKAPGPKSEFYVHQDTTGLDESKFSPLNLWIPLTHVNQNNGCLGLVPHSHKFFTPYRSISFPAPFDTINATVKKYLHPMEMKAGEALLFDNRLVHHSYPNLSNEVRVAVVCGVFPKDAQMITCFKPAYELGGRVEFISHEDEFLIENPNFLIDCQNRPKTGESIGFRKDPYLEIDPSTFEELCRRSDVKPVATGIVDTQLDCNLIGEPITKA